LNSLKGRTTFGMNLRKKFYLLHKADSWTWDSSLSTKQQ
jgi:hypothetical protein